MSEYHNFKDTPVIYMFRDEDYNLNQVDEWDWSQQSGEIFYERHTVQGKAASQITLTKKVNYEY